MSVVAEACQGKLVLLSSHKEGLQAQCCSAAWQPDHEDPFADALLLSTVCLLIALLQDHKAAAEAYEETFSSLCLSHKKGPDAERVFHEPYAVMSGVQVATQLAQVIMTDGGMVTITFSITG
jgi:hypothetical protein